MNLKNFIKGIRLLRPFYADPDGYHIQAEHDQFFMDATNRPVPREIVKELKDLGWFQPNVDKDGYDISESWSCNT
jgi:alkylation response protein AidB-like acyl-CoA dehydrogenase